MEADVGAFIQGCSRCLLFKTRKEVRAPLVPMRPRAPLHIVGVDFLTLGRPADRFQNILVATDLFTKYAWAIPTLDQTATTTATALWKTVFQPFGCPEILHSDQGPNFESRVIRELCLLYGCRKTHTTPYHPQGNGGCERFNQTLLSLLGTLDADQQGSWVLVRDVQRQGKGKLSDWWEATPYVVERQRDADLPVYVIRPEGRLGHKRVLHRNLLRPCPNYSGPTEEVPTAPKTPAPPVVGWAVVPGGPELVAARRALSSSPRRSQRDNRGQPPARYGEWVTVQEF